METVGRIDKCQGDRACIWPPSEAGYCVHHLRDMECTIVPEAVRLERILAGFERTQKLMSAFVLITSRRIGDRKISQLSGLSYVTVLRLRRRISGELNLQCGCGRQVAHNGRCHHRRAARNSNVVVQSPLAASTPQ